MRAITFFSTIKQRSYDHDIWRDTITNHLDSYGITVAGFSSIMDYLLSELYEVTIWLESEEDYNIYSLLYPSDRDLARVVDNLYTKRVNSN